MGGACLSIWQTDAGEASIAKIWWSSDFVLRTIYISLGLMLAYTLFVLLQFIRGSISASREFGDTQSDSGPDFERKEIQLISDLTGGLGTLRGIAVAAPFLGLAGTSYGILAEFSGWGSSKSSAVLFLLRATPSTLVTAAVGILAAVSAIVIHNALRHRVEKLRGELFVVTEAQNPIGRAFRRAQMFPLKRRFSCHPPYAIIAAPLFATFVIVYILLKPYELPKGLPVGVALDRCEPGLIDRPLVLHITNQSTIFINTEEETCDKLRSRLGETYRKRQDRTLFLQAENDVRFQTVADAMDIARSAIASSDSSRLSVRLITPRTQAVNATCHTPLWTGPRLLSPK